MFILFIALAFLQFLNLIKRQIESKAVKALTLLCKHSFPLNPVSRRSIGVKKKLNEQSNNNLRIMKYLRK